jgi:hypothetical protein
MDGLRIGLQEDIGALGQISSFTFNFSQLSQAEWRFYCRAHIVGAKTDFASASLKNVYEAATTEL